MRVFTVSSQFSCNKNVMVNGEENKTCPQTWLTFTRENLVKNTKSLVLFSVRIT